MRDRDETGAECNTMVPIVSNVQTNAQLFAICALDVQIVQRIVTLYIGCATCT